MKRTVTLAICFVLLLVGIILVSNSATPAHAQGKSCTVPKAFGTLRGSVMGDLLFEAPDGTIRGVTDECRVEGTIQRR
jgi:hypothetical protein